MTDTTNPDPGNRLSDQAAPAAETDPAPGENTETFDRQYVQKLRDEAAGYRVKAKRADALAAALVTAHVVATRRMADPTDLPYSDDLLNDQGVPDADKVRAAVDDLLKRKPHLAARRPTGDIGQGARFAAAEEGLAFLLRRQA